MPLDVIKPGKHLKLSYSTVPKNRRVDYEVEANRPVTTFVVDDDGLHEYYNKRGGDVTSYFGGFYRRRNHRETVSFPRDFSGPWYLVIENDSDTEPVAVKYQVFI